MSTFSPSNVTGEPETEIWYAYDNPLTAILHIDIQGNDGSVICSKYNSNEWYFTPLTTPFLDGDDYDGTHPVSGNRAFGIKQNPDGSYTIYNAIAWIGLKGTKAWNDPAVNQSQINSIINNVISNETHSCHN